MSHRTDNTAATRLECPFDSDLAGVNPDDPVPYWPAGLRLAAVREV